MAKDFWKTKQAREYGHYILVYAALLISWPIVMDATNDLLYTVPIVFAVFVIADRTVHKMFGLK